LRFWLDRGIDGFRIDAAPAMAKKAGLPDADYGSAMRFASADWVDNPHWDVDEVHDILRRWRRVLDDYPGDRVFVGEALVSSPGRLARYLRPDELHTAFNFEFLHARWDHDELRAVIAATLAALEPVRAPATWVLSNHDEIRHLTRLGRTGPTEGRPGAATTVDLQVGARRARAALLLSLALPGSSYLYQGEELGLPEVEDLPDEARQDPVFSESGGLVLGRDGCRVPLPWSGSEPPFGFSPLGTHPWLPQPPSWRELTVQAQSGRAGSMLEFYRHALTLRRTVLQVAADDLTWLPAQERVLAFERGSRFRCVVNLSSHAVALDEEPALASAPLVGPALLPPDAAAWFLSGPDRQT
jgi:alpha-glucosidase